MNNHSATLVLGTLLCIAGYAPVTCAQLPVSTNLVASAVETPAGQQFSIVFSDTGTGGSSYLLEHTPVLGDNAVWTVDPAAVVTSQGGGVFRATTTRPASFGAYRLVAYDASGQLSAGFASPSVELEEGAGGYNLYIVFSKPFTGTLTYIINDASGGLVSPLSGSVTVSNATSARIPIEVADNASVNELQFISLTINGGGGVAIGGAGQMVVTIRDNDAVWNGSFVGGGLEFGFKYRITKSGGSTQAVLTSDGSGVLPAGDYPVMFNVPGQLFPSAVSGIAMPTTSSLLGLSSSMSLAFDVQNGVGDDVITDTEMQGSATVSLLYPTKPYLNSTQTGRFVLLRPPPDPSTAEVQLVNNP